MNQKATLLKDAKRKTTGVLYSTPYERDTPNMSRAISLKCGGYVYAFSEYVPFTLFIKEL